MRLQTLRQAAGWDDRRCDELIERLEAAAAVRFEAGRLWPKAPLRRWRTCTRGARSSPRWSQRWPN
jgi:hypothetical protein